MKVRLLAVAISAVAAPPLPTEAGPPVLGPSGNQCGYYAVADPAPDAPPDGMTGLVYGGTLAWDQPFTLHCYLRVNVNQHLTHHGFASVDEHAGSTSSQGTHSATLAPTWINFVAGVSEPQYLCTAVSFAGGTLYWIGSRGVWTTDVTKPCQ